MTTSKHTESNRGWQIDLKKMFIVSLVLGAIGIVAGQLLNLVSVSLAIPLIVMFVYLFIGQKVSDQLTMTEQFADSIYYLGFLFTLSALVISLWNMQSDDIVISNLVGNFALALITTIVGLSARIYIINFQRDFSTSSKSLEANMVQEVESMLGVLRRTTESLNRYINDMGDLNNRMLVDTQGRFESSLDVMDKVFVESSTTLRRMGEHAVDRMENTFDSLVEKVDAVELPADILLRKIEPVMDGVAESLNQNQVSMNAVTNKQKGLVDELQKLMGKMEAVNKGTEVLNHSVNTLDNVIQDKLKATSLDELSKMQASLNSFIGVLQSSLPAIDNFSDNTEQASNSLQEYNEALSGQESALNDMGDIARKNAEISILHQEKTAQALKESRQAVDKVSQHFVDAAQFVCDKLATANP